jgi:predicted lipoprotein with Yx(FWY)xxD motif
MTRHSATVVLAIAAFLVAGCGGDDDDQESAAAAASAGIVSIETVDGTDVLADAQGRTLYTADVEKGGKIMCVGACTSFWAPLIASADEAEAAASELEADISVLRRPEGSRQLTFDGLPLYTFTEEAAGELTGDGFVDDFEGTRFEWQAARTDGGSAPTNQDGGYGY